MPIAGEFSPLSLFAAGEEGAWFDPADLSTLYQDAEGTTPVTEAGQPVGLMLDKSGNGNHATQSTDAARPVLQQDGARYYLAFDGDDDFLVTGSVDFTGTDKMSLFSAARKHAEANAILCELGSNYNLTNPAFDVFVPSTGRYEINCRGAAGYNGYATEVHAAPHSAVLTGVFDLSGSTRDTECLYVRVNGANEKSSPVNSFADNSGTFLNAPINIGGRNGSSNFFEGRLYGLIVRGETTDLEQIVVVEQYLTSPGGGFQAAWARNSNVVLM